MQVFDFLDKIFIQGKDVVRFLALWSNFFFEIKTMVKKTFRY